MKIRNGFVSNSSSSSFTCDICGETESGMDLCLSDAEMFECENGHTFHTGCSESKEVEKFLENCCDEEIEDPDNPEEYIKNPDFNEDGRYEVPAKFCDICNFREILDNDGLCFLLNKLGRSRADLIKEIKDTFKDSGYTEFKKTLKKE